MRELKFRVWDSVDKVFIGEYDIYDGCPYHHDKSRREIMQFTGLLDKNGKDIYEGDLLDFGNKNPVEVIFKNGSFTVFNEPLGWDFDSEEHPVETDFQYCEVVGNRHQNPELLNK